MEVFYETYLNSIDPTKNYYELFNKNIIAAISIHSLIYYSVYMLLVQLFNLEDKSDLFMKVILVVMILGYFGRLYRSKSIYNYYLKNGYDNDESKTVSINQINHAYFTWYYFA